MKNTATQTKPNDFFYFIKEKVFIICDLNCCAKSNNTFDIDVFALANNRELLDKIHLYYMVGDYGANYTYESRGEWFAGYLSAFSTSDNGQYDKLVKNPVIRMLIEDDKLLSEIKALDI